MYYITFCVIAILIICALLGLKRGLFKTLFGLIAVVLSIGVTYVASPYISAYIVEHTEIDEYIENRIYTKIESQLQKRVAESLQSSGVTTDLSKLTQEETSHLLSVEIDRATQVQLIDEMDIPESIKTAFIENNNKSTYETLGTGTFYKYISEYTGRLILNAIVLVGTFVILRSILALIGLIINKIIGGTPILSGLNRMAGMVLGLLIGCAMIWVFMIIAGFAFGASYDSMIAGNPVLEFIDSHNLITTIITKL